MGGAERVAPVSAALIEEYPVGLEATAPRRGA